ncbi:hypothetical protein D3C74_08480 [compost metagenome]
MAKYVLYPFVFLIACGLLYIYPMQSAFDQQDQVAYNMAYRATTNFVDAARNKGYITPVMYNDFVQELGTWNLYDIQLEHKAKQYHPIYSDLEDPDSFTGRTDVFYDARYTKEVMATLFPGESTSDESASRKYYMRTGDFFSVTVRNTNTTKATLIRDFLTGNESIGYNRIYIPYGGMILNEDF